MKTNPSTILAIVRLPVELKDYAGKWAHIWKVDEDTVVVRFSESKGVDGLPSVYLGVQQMANDNIEERLRKLETTVEELKDTILSPCNNSKAKTKRNQVLRPGFEPGSRDRESRMIGRATPPELISAWPMCL